MTAAPLAAGRRKDLKADVGDGEFTRVPWVHSGVFRRIYTNARVSQLLHRPQK